MSPLRGFRKLHALLRRRALEREMDEEMRLHVELEAADLERAGAEPAQAKRQAAIRFGGVERFKEEGRRARGVPGLEHLLRDLRLAVRSLLRAPSFTLVAVSTLALGIGANTAIFSVVRGVLLTPLPYRDSDRVVLLWGADATRGLSDQPIAYPDFVDLRSRTRALDDVAVWRRATVTIEGDAPDRVVTELASANLFALLGVEPALGRVFDEEQEAAREPVVVISHDLWQRRFAGSPGVLEQTLVLTGDMQSGKQGPRTLRVIGVMPAGFSFPTPGVSLWEPAATYWRFERERQDRTIATWNAVGRLAPDATVAQARDELTAVAEQVSAAASDGARPSIEVVRVIDYLTGSDLQRALWVLLAAVGFVLLIACANVASLILARGLARERELATRIALGAGRADVARQLLVESALLVLVATLAGTALAQSAVRLLVSVAPADIPRLDQIGIDRVVLLFTVGISAASGALCALLPALRTSVSAPTRAPGSGARGASDPGRQLTRQLLVVGECALAVVLLTGAGLLLRSYARLSAVDPGFASENLLTVQLLMPRAGPLAGGGAVVPGTPAMRGQLALDVIDRVRALPGVVGVSSTPSLIDRSDPELQITIPSRRAGAAPEPGNVGQGGVSPGLLETLGVPLLTGRTLSEEDYSDRIVPSGFEETALVNESFARLYFPGESPLGQRFRVGEPGPKEWWVEVGGVVGDFRRRGLERAAGPEFFTAVPGFGETQLIVRTSGEPRAMLASVEEAVRSVSSDVGVLSAGTVEEQLGAMSARRRFQTTLLGVFAGLALVLAAVGIYGLMHYTVSRRLPELGVRMALGAQSRDVAVLMLRECLELALVGAALGLLAALALSRVLEHLLFEVSASDPATLGGVALLLVVVALLAAYLPTVRATRANPTSALRAE